MLLLSLGCTNTTRLFQEIVAHGFQGTRTIMRAAVATLRATGLPELTVSPRTPQDTDEPRSAAVASIRHQHHHTIHDLAAVGWEQRAIAAHLGIHPKTVSRHLRRPRDMVPDRQPRSSLLDPYRAYLMARWEEGCTNASQLVREVVSQGFRGKKSTVRALITRLRKDGSYPAIRTIAMARQAGTMVPSRQTLARWMVRPEETLTATQEAILQQIGNRAAELATMMALAHAFGRMVRTQTVAAFDPWLDAMETSGLAAFARLARGMRQDAAAIRAALSLPWSQGPVEGTINRLKTLKRAMYGRAKLDLLRQRVLVRSIP